MVQVGFKYTDLEKVVRSLVHEYITKTKRKEKMIDLFIVYIMLTGIIQFLYCAMVGTFPFNSFLSGFISSVALFCLTVSLRMQLLNPSEFHGISPQRAYADYAICNVILHFVVLTFMG